jgi:hypothetical protein
MLAREEALTGDSTSGKAAAGLCLPLRLPSTAAGRLQVFMGLTAMLLHSLSGASNVGAMGAAIALVDRQPWDRWVSWVGGHTGSLREINPQVLQHLCKDCLTQGRGGHW